MSRLLFQLTAFAATTFVITILAMIAMMMGDPEAPVNHWFDKHGATLMTIEVFGIIVFGFAAMTADRRETLREIKQSSETTPDTTDKEITS